MRKHFPHVTVIARARNRFHAHNLMELGVKLITRETFLSSLAMAQETLEAAGFDEVDARDTVARFRRHDEEVLQRQFAVRLDEDKLIQTLEGSDRRTGEPVRPGSRLSRRTSDRCPPRTWREAGSRSTRSGL